MLVYGLGAGLPLAAIQMGAPTAVLHPLALASPALWQCGLASVDGSAPSGIDLVAEIARVMRGEWIDPLALLERVQQLTAQLKPSVTPIPRPATATSGWRGSNANSICSSGRRLSATTRLSPTHRAPRAAP